MEGGIPEEFRKENERAREEERTYPLLPQLPVIKTNEEKRKDINNYYKENNSPLRLVNLKTYFLIIIILIIIAIGELGYFTYSGYYKSNLTCINSCPESPDCNCNYNLTCPIQNYSINIPTINVNCNSTG